MNRPLLVALTALLLFFPRVAAQAAKPTSQAVRTWRLSDDERRRLPDLAAREAKISSHAASISERLKALNSLENEEATVLAPVPQLEAEARHATTRLSDVAGLLWRINVSGADEGYAMNSPSAEQRRLTSHWLASLGNSSTDATVVVTEKKKAIAELDAKASVTRGQLAHVRMEIDLANAKLLEDVLAYWRGLIAVRGENGGEAAMLLMAIATDLGMGPARRMERPFSVSQGQLAWPAKGGVVRDFEPGGKTPHPGIGMALPPNGPVSPVAIGKVIYEGNLRDYGNVLILAHGEGYFSVYGHLSKVKTSLGQDVAPGDVMAQAGRYQEMRGGPGLYFELRSREKAINPHDWLAVQN